MRYRVAEVFSQDPQTGRALWRHPAFPVEIVLCNNRDVHHPMGRFRQWLVGARTPAMCWTDGVWYSEPVLSTQPIEVIIQNLFHENGGHWWEMWKRMGPTDFKATYGWQAALTFWTTGRVPHDALLQEQHADKVKDMLWDRLMAHMRVIAGPSRFDMLPYLQQYYPEIPK